jgi:outer membrane protein assembly factor BamB
MGATLALRGWRRYPAHAARPIFSDIRARLVRNASMSTAASTAEQPVATPTPRCGPRVAPMAVVVAAYWATYAGVGVTDLGAFHKFLLRMGALAITLLAFVGWWLFQRRVPRRGRLAVMGAVGIALAVMLAFRHASIQGPLVMATAIRCIEVMLTGWALWLVVARNAATTTIYRGMAVVAAAAWLWALAVRMEGFAGNAQSAFLWRWTPSGEELFLAEQATKSLPAVGATAAEPLVATGADWPGFRGAARDGAVHDVQIATNWGDSPPKELWRRRVGPGWSSIAVVGARLFTQEQRANDEAVVCFDANTGEQVWVHVDRGRFDEAMGGVGPRATPTFAHRSLYALGATGILNCLDAATGDLKWSRDVKADGQSATPIWGFCSSPLVVDGKVIVFAGAGESHAGEEQTPVDPSPKPTEHHALLAYDAGTGELAWRAAAGSHSYSSPQLAEFDGTPQVLFLSNTMLAAVDPATGKSLWNLPTNARREGVPAIQPHVLGDAGLIASFSADSPLIRCKVVHEGDAWSIDETWSSRALKPFFSDFVQVDDALYGFDGNIFCCVDATTGKRLWKGGRYGSGQVLLVAEQPVLVVVTEAGEAVLVAADAQEHRELGRFQAIEGKTWQHPTIVRGRLYVRNAEEMACFKL